MTVGHSPRKPSSLSLSKGSLLSFQQIRREGFDKLSQVGPFKRLIAISAPLALLGGCSLEPHYVRPTPAVPTTLPQADVGTAAPLDRRAIFRDPRLLGLIDRAIADNQNLRQAIANAEVARGQYRAQRAEQLPQIGATGGVGVADRGSGGAQADLSAGLGLSAFELDLFGRVRSLSRAAQDDYLASEAGARAVRVTLVGDVAEAWFTYAYDRGLLAIDEDTRRVAGEGVRITRARLQGGVAPRSDLDQALTIEQTAAADAARQTAQVAQDRNALQLLLGGPVSDAELPISLDDALGTIVPPPVGLPSEVLLRRPDVLAAEYRLQAANARIGAARAAFFPRISLTGLLGFASSSLGGLFSGGAFNYSTGADATLPIFDGGRNSGNLLSARAGRDAAVAGYQDAIQTAFREVADALARRATLGDEDRAARALVGAAQDNAYLADARYRGGVDTFLSSLDAQRTLYSARRRSLAGTGLSRAVNTVALYRALGGDAQIDR